MIQVKRWPADDCVWITHRKICLDDPQTVIQWQPRASRKRSSVHVKYDGLNCAVSGQAGFGQRCAISERSAVHEVVTASAHRQSFRPRRRTLYAPHCAPSGDRPLRPLSGGLAGHGECTLKRRFKRDRRLRLEGLPGVPAETAKSGLAKPITAPS